MQERVARLAFLNLWISLGRKWIDNQRKRL
jgi:hypothetical protein